MILTLSALAVCMLGTFALYADAADYTYVWNEQCAIYGDCTLTNIYINTGDTVTWEVEEGHEFRLHAVQHGELKYTIENSALVNQTYSITFEREGDWDMYNAYLQLSEIHVNSVLNDTNAIHLDIHTALQDDHATLSSNHTQLRIDHEDLGANYTKLQSRHYSLHSDYNNVLWKHNNLALNYTMLEGSFEEFKAEKHEELRILQRDIVTLSAYIDELTGRTP